MIAAVKRGTRRLRAMRESDLAQVMRIERCAYPFPWPESEFRYCLRTAADCVVLVEDGVVQGYGVLAIEGKRAHVMNLCVDPPFQRRGLGARILRRLLRLARHRGADVAFLEVRPSNFAARTFYEKMGFIRSAVRDAYYPARRGREDALIMTRAL